MQLFASTPGGTYPYATSNTRLSGWTNKQIGNYPNQTSPTNIELYGTSWMYDLMAAKQYAPGSLRQTSSWFNGATDANYGFTPNWNPQGANGKPIAGQHATHDLGMAFDLGVSGNISNLAGGAQFDKFDKGNTAEIRAAIDAALKAHADGWSVADAAKEASLLVNEEDENGQIDFQANALKDFLSLYALTQTADGQQGLQGKVLNTTAADLFGNMITSVLIGGSGSKENPYTSINDILKDLGITSSAVDPHNSHFHIYLKPPTPKEITGPAHLLADAATASQVDPTTPATLQDQAQGLLDYTQTLIEGDELMFTMDVPYAPAQQTPIVLAQAATPSTGATPQPDFILNACGETESTGDPRSAMRAVDPAGMISNYMQGIYNRPVELSSIKNITLLQGTKHGTLLQSTSNTTGRTTFHYDPTPDYIGNDRAVFRAEFEGKVYKIVVELHVFMGATPGDFGASTCPEPQLIKVTKPSSGDSGFGAGYDLSSVSVSFADLEGSVIGLANASGITLDDNAAGYNWFIDTTPADNSEYLPTSNPDEWVAKEGTAAYGKMDMLTVLLHEYGHALGIEHSADNHDYMATTLTPGVRRMPSADELALMQQLVAQAKDGLVGRVTPADSTPDNTPTPFPTLPFGTTLSLAFLGRLRSSRYGDLSIAPDYATLTTKYAVAANATFTNLNSPAGWNTQGSATFNPDTPDPASTSSGQASTGSVRTASVTLNEVSTSQTRLSQVFMLNEQDRYLSFTLRACNGVKSCITTFPVTGD